MIVIGRGRLVADTSMAAFLARSSQNGVLVRTPHAADLILVVLHAGGSVSQDVVQGPLTVRGLSAEEIGSLAGRNGLWLYELAPPARLARGRIHGTHRRRRRVRRPRRDRKGCLT